MGDWFGVFPMPILCIVAEHFLYNEVVGLYILERVLGNYNKNLSIFPLLLLDV